MNNDVVVLAGRPVGPLRDRLRRYCGLEWSGGPPEVWAYRYYDMIANASPSSFDPVDLLAAGAVHPGLGRSDLAWFTEHTGELNRWLENTADAPLADADEATLTALRDLVRVSDGASLGLLTKVLHRKRPNLVPIAERRLIDWYRPVTGERSPVTAWPSLIEHLAADLRDERNEQAINDAVDELRGELPVAMSALRAADICLWMGGER